MGAPTVETTQPQVPRNAARIQRMIYGSTAVALLILVFAVDALLARPPEGALEPSILYKYTQHGSLIPLAFALLIIAAVLEMDALMRAKHVRPFTRFATVISVAMAMTPWFSAAGLLGQTPIQLEGFYWPFVWWIVLAVGIGVGLLVRGDPVGSVRDVGGTISLVFLLGFLPWFGLQLRCSRDVPPEQGAWLLLIVLLVTKASDMGAYFIGSAIGRRRLAPNISPGKSVEGTVGGILASVLVSVAIGYLGWCPAFQLATSGNPAGIPQWGLVVFGVVLAVCGQLGDLLESCFKRDAGIKDSGRIIPGLGGILDVVDSPLLALPASWFLLTFVFDVA